MHRRSALMAAATVLAGATLSPAGAAPTSQAPRGRSDIDATFPFLEVGPRARLFYKDWGDGEPTVVFVHGWPLNANMWDLQMLHLAKAGLRVIAYDQRGCGRSTDPGRGYDFDTLADDLASVLEQLDLRRVVLVGHSIGCGQIVRYLTRRGSSRVSGVVLLSASLPYVQRSPDNPDGLDPVHFDSVRHYLATDPAKWVGRAARLSFPPETSPEMIDWTIRMCLDNSPWAMTATSHIDVETDFRRELPALKVRTLVVHGDADLTCAFETTGRRVAQLVPGAELKTYPGAGHALFLTHTAQFNDDLIAFAKA